MEFNPYSPPKHPANRLHSSERRPIAVWIMIVVLVSMVVLLVIGAVRTLWLVPGQETQDLVVLFAVAKSLAIAGGYTTVLVGIVRRRQWARWAGLAVLGFWLALTLFRPDSTSYANHAAMLGGLFAGKILLPVLLAWWGYAFALSDRAQLYFVKKVGPIKT